MSDSNPTVSVIIPCFNQGAYLDEAVRSVLAQTYQSLEIIIVNDGSTDEQTVRLLQAYEEPELLTVEGEAAKTDGTPSLTVIHTPNWGPSAARNTGVQQAKGQYILPLDADDRIAPTYLEKAVAILDREPNVGIVYPQVEKFSDPGDRTEPLSLPLYSFPAILLGNMIVNSSLYRKADWEKVGGYNENMRWGWEDYDFWLSLIELGREVVSIPEVLFAYRQVSNSRSQQMTHEYWVKSYTQLFINHPKLYSDHIDTLFQELVELRDNVHQTHTQLHQAQLEAFSLQEQLMQSRVFISEVENSKFWQLRNQWLKLKRRFGLMDHSN